MESRGVWNEEEVAVYPPIKYKEWTLFPWPHWKEDTDKYLKLLKNFKSREDDILLCTVQKGGSHWVHEIVCMLVDQTTTYNNRGSSLDDVHLDTMTDFDSLEKETKRRIIHTHLPFQCIPSQHMEKKGKTIFVNRNPKDRHVSQYVFFKKMFGTPPDYSWDQYFQEMVINDTFMSGWFNYTREMVSAVEKYSNVIHVLFEDLKLNQTAEIKRIADFLEVPYTNKLINEIADKCEFDKLKTNKLDGTAEYAKDNKSTLFRKGIIGDWKNWFTVAENEQFDEMYKREMKDVSMSFIYEDPSGK
ncbi:Hypothetical predicted protein [Mytilus galloprovincialis]|uniref:Sulfotransferase domain-containing protein n=2 Tax=Mytilus galloprovincialis TaxID=29158 RepID=A0A8B6BMK6_MYTGA|nr:Hypothetical predicted protein [Mytilus galloprovincialis]